MSVRVARSKEDWKKPSKNNVKSLELKVGNKNNNKCKKMCKLGHEFKKKRY